MKLRFEYGGVEYSARSILEFTSSTQNEYWCGPFFHFYPDVDRAAYTALDDPGRLAFLKGYLPKYEALIPEKLEKYTAHWQAHEAQIYSAFADAFGRDISGIFNDMVCNVTFNPISPRYLAGHRFDSFYLESEKGALGTALHELIHFLWFHVWQEHFHDAPSEYETPHLKWILSEMAVEPIMRDPRLGGINPYFTHNACVYSYFYTMHIEGRPILDTLHDMYAALPIQKFMEEAYAYCLLHENEIRAHIAACENP